jgi:hypothetical protein
MAHGPVHFSFSYHRSWWEAHPTAALGRRPFNEVGTELAKRWWLAIEKNSLFNQHHLVTAYKTGRNLRSNLVRSLLAAPIRKKQAFTKTSASGTTRYINTRCRVCSYITTGDFVRSHKNCKQYNTIGKINCKTSNIIYLISCKYCNQPYVGETSRPLADRVNTHLPCIRTRTGKNNLAIC